MTYLLIIKYESGNTCVTAYDDVEEVKRIKEYMEKDKYIKSVEIMFKCDSKTWYSWED